MSVGPAIVGLGMATVDVLARVPRLPGPDEVFELEALEIQGGGPVASALVAAARLGSSTAMIGSTDDGGWGRMIVDGLRGAGVDVTHLLRRADGRAPRSVILVDAADGRRSILYSRGTAASPTVAELPWPLIRGARVLHLDGFHLEASVAAARAAREAGVAVSLDGGAGEPWPGLDELLPLVDLLIVARAFATQVTGVDVPEEAGPALARIGARHVVITDGARGAWAWVGGGMRHQPAYRVEVVDTTGAGDAFHGGYLHAWARGADPGMCLRVASAVGALACTRLGGRAGLPDAGAVEALLAQQAG